jgi:hypothetical protein
MESYIAVGGGLAAARMFTAKKGAGGARVEFADVNGQAGAVLFAGDTPDLRGGPRPCCRTAASGLSFL